MERQYELVDLRHLEFKDGQPICGADPEGAIIVEEPKSVTCEECRRMVN